MSTTFVKVNHGGKTQVVALFDGISTEEIASILKTVFSTSGAIVGFTAENGMVFPLSVVCRSPRSVGTSVCTLLVAKSEKPTVSNKLEEANSRSEPVSEDEISSEYVMQEIIRFIEGLKERGFLSKSQERLLLELLLENSTLLFAAYSVAISAQDSEYLAEICKDLVQSLTTAEGRVACEAQDEVLQVCDQLYINDKITENQLLYLRHLVLIRDESVASLYDDFQEHQNVPLLAKALYDLSNTHPYQHAQQPKIADSDSSDGEDGDDESQESEKDNAALVEGLSGVVALMIRSRVISNSEASVLLDLVRSENEYVCAAYELFTYDQNLEELQDTLLRCGKLEIRRRAAESPSSSVQEEPVQKARVATSNASTSPVFDIDKISLEAILASVQVSNVWASVPKPFVRAVFVAVLKQNLSVEQGKALCDLFAADYDLVTAAWEVYTVQEDSVDLVDTLQRIVRDISADDTSEQEEKPQAQRPQQRQQQEEEDEDDSQDSDYNTDDAEEDEANESEDSQEEEEEEENSSDDEQQPTNSAARNAAANQEVQDRKSQALAAVASAKRDLLRHSLEMMVKQGMTSAESAGELYSRYLGGDLLIAAAIESYANDRDVSDFLDTLQVLANTSAELLQSVMRDIEGDDARQAQQTTQQQRSPAQKAAASSPQKAASPAKTASPVKSSSSEGEKSGSLLSKADQKTFVDILTRASAISPSQTASLSALIDRGDRQVGEIFAQYEADKDVYKLIDTLKALDAQDDEEEEEESEEEEEEEESEEEEEEDEQQQQSNTSKHSIESKFLEIVQSMSLSHLETAALRLAIARNDDSIRRAIESFRQNLNEEALKRALKGIAVDTISATMNEEDEDRHEQTQQQTRNARHNVEEEVEEEEREQSGNEDNDEEEEEEEDDDNNGDDDEEEEEEDNGTSWITSQTARDHVFPILISELVKENILSAHAGAVVMQQFGAKNPVIGAALDVYDQSNDMAQLVDTLLEVVGTF